MLHRDFLINFPFIPGFPGRLSSRRKYNEENPDAFNLATISEYERENPDRLKKIMGS